jgi:cytochrome P450
MSELTTIDLTNLELFKDGPPYEVFARLRAESPVHWNATSTGGFWSLTKADDIERVSKDPATFSSYARGVNIEVDNPWPLEVKRATMIGMDPPAHTQYRAIVQKVFTPHRVNRQEQQIRNKVTRLLDQVCEQGTCDFVTDVALELPLQTIAEMLGVPHEDRMNLFHWTKRVEAAMQVPGSDDGLHAFGEMAVYLATLLEQRRRQPQDDLISALIAAEVDGERLDDAHLNACFGLLMFAGNDTTRNTASGGLLALIEHPAERQKLIEDPSLIPGAVEELLRWVSAVVHFRRTATADTEIRGVPVKEGDAVVIWYASGNRDEDWFPDPARFDVTRREVKHQAFGGGGRHFCLGSALGRLQLRVLFEELLRRMPDLQLAGDPVHTGSNFINGLDSLPVQFTPSRANGQ